MALQQQGQQQGSIPFAQHAAARHVLSAVAAGAKLLLPCCRWLSCLLVVGQWWQPSCRVRQPICWLTSPMQCAAHAINSATTFHHPAKYLLIHANSTPAVAAVCYTHLCSKSSLVWFFLMTLVTKPTCCCCLHCQSCLVQDYSRQPLLCCTCPPSLLKMLL